MLLPQHLHVRDQSPPHVVLYSVRTVYNSGAAPSSPLVLPISLPARHRHGGRACTASAIASAPGPSTAKAKGQRTTRTTSTALLLNMISISSVTSRPTGHRFVAPGDLPFPCAVMGLWTRPPPHRAASTRRLPAGSGDACCGVALAIDDGKRCAARQSS